MQTLEELGSDELWHPNPTTGDAGGVQRGQAHLLSVGSTVRLRAGCTTGLMQKLMPYILKRAPVHHPKTLPSFSAHCDGANSQPGTKPEMYKPMESNWLSPQCTAYSIHVLLVAAQLAGWPARHTKYKPLQGPQNSKREKESDPADVLSHTCILSLLLPLYQTLQSKGLFKTDRHLTGDAVFQLFIVLWISLQFDEHPFKVQHHSPSHFSSSACRCRNARPWAWEGRCFSWAEAAGALPVPPQPGRGGGRSGSASSVATLSAAKLGLIQFQSPVCLLPRRGSLTPRSRSLSETRLRKGAEPRARRGTGAGKARSGEQDVAACELCQRSVLCASCTDRERMDSLCLPASPVVWAVLWKPSLHCVPFFQCPVPWSRRFLSSLYRGRTDEPSPKRDLCYHLKELHPSSPPPAPSTPPTQQSISITLGASGGNM